MKVRWFARGGILTKPTVFGMNGNTLMAGGEAGNEAVLPLNQKTLGMIGRGIAEAMGESNQSGGAITAGESRIIGLLNELLKKEIIEVHNEFVGDRIYTSVKRKEARERNKERYFD